MYFATGVEPTKLTDAISGDCKILSTTLLSPFTIVRTFSGKPASCNNSPNFKEHCGTFSEGLSINTFPHAIAIGNIHIGTIAGKLKGVIPAQIPNGCFMSNKSTFVPTFIE